MRFPYKNDLPLASIKILGKTRRHEIEAHIDFAASKTIIPPDMAEELELKFAGFEGVATGGGIVLMPEYEAVVEAFGNRHGILVGCIDLPEESAIKALIGRDILDGYKLCLDGKNKEVEVTDP